MGYHTEGEAIAVMGYLGVIIIIIIAIQCSCIMTVNNRLIFCAEAFLI